MMDKDNETYPAETSLMTKEEKGDKLWRDIS
jgi:hypothetical protein